MTDNLQLQTTRLTDASAGNLVDNSISEIENAISVLFGITKDTPIAQVMSITAGGDVTMVGDLIMDAAPANNLHCATKLYADDNASFGGGGSYVVDVGGTLGEGAQIANAGEEFLSFKGDNEAAGWSNIEEGNDAQFDYATDPTKLVCKSSGDYLIYCNYSILYVLGGDVYDPFEYYMNLHVNGAEDVANIDSTYIYDVDAQVASPKSRGFMIMRTLSADDYLQVSCVNPNSEGALEISIFNCWFGMVKLG